MLVLTGREPVSRGNTLGVEGSIRQLEPPPDQLPGFSPNSASYSLWKLDKFTFLSPFLAVKGLSGSTDLTELL